MPMKNDYVSVVYDEKRTPRTAYPRQLASYLASRFGIKKNATFLEIGCGRGDFALAFKSLGIDVQAVDRSACSVQELEGIPVKQADVSCDPLPYEDNMFDVVYHKSLIEHLYVPGHLMTETLRVLKPGGRLIVLTPDWVSQMAVFYEDFTHSRPYTAKALIDLFMVHGLEAAEAELFYQLPSVWRHGALKGVCRILQFFIPVPAARGLASMTGIAFFRWSVELMVLATGIKPVAMPKKV